MIQVIYAIRAVTLNGEVDYYKYETDDQMWLAYRGLQHIAEHQKLDIYKFTFEGEKIGRPSWEKISAEDNPLNCFAKDAGNLVNKTNEQRLAEKIIGELSADSIKNFHKDVNRNEAYEVFRKLHED